MSDAELVACAREGDRSAFGHLLTRHRQFAWSVCAGLLAGDRDAIEDVLQEAAVVALVSLDRLRDPERFGAWLCGIALNIAWRRIRETRRTYPARALSEAVVDGDPGPPEHAEAADLARRVRDAISHLPSGQRDAVMLFYLQGLTHREVAEELDISTNAVKARLHQARAALQPKLASLHQRKEALPMTASPAWIDVQISDVRRGDDDQSAASFGQPHVVVLTDASGDRHLPIWIGRFEATALATTLDSVEMPRPMTYQFAANLLGATEWHVSEVRITGLAAGTFYAQLILEHSGQTRTIEARPSDALNLAVLSNVPIRVDSTLFEDLRATRLPDWRNYPTKAPDLAAEVRKNNERTTQWLRSLQQDTDADDADAANT